MSPIPHTKTSTFSRFLKHKKKSIKAFTLIELLVVIGVLGILTILVVQSLGDAKTTSVDAQVKASLRSLNQAHARAFLVGDSGIPNAVDPVWVGNPENAVNWYISNGYLILSDFDENVLNYIEIRPNNSAEFIAGFDPVNIWKRKP